MFDVGEIRLDIGKVRLDIEVFINCYDLVKCL